MTNLYAILIKYLQSGANIQTGTLLSTKGSAPQVPGAMAIFEQERVVSGTLGGGLLEAQAQKVAAESAKTRENRLEWVNFTAEMEDQTGAICGGSALFMIDANPEKHLDVYLQLIDSMKQRKCGALVSLINVPDKQTFTIDRYWFQFQESIPENITSHLLKEQVDITKIITSRVPFFKEISGVSPNTKTILFIEPIHPKPQLIIVGAGHIGQALCRISALVDFEITVLDDRPELAVSSRFPEAFHLICHPLSMAFQSLKITTDTYIVIATQGHRTDIEALRCCIGSDAAYIGVIGSRRKTALMKQKFNDERWATPEEWDFVHTPIGIDIHSQTVNEIAVSILAELIRERHEINYLRSKKSVSSIVLAAGKSTRMGQQKLLMPFEGGSMVETIVWKIAQSNSIQTIVVTGHEKSRVEEVLKDCGVQFADNKNYEAGMLTSVQTGVKAIVLESTGFLVFLGDQPMVSVVVINRLIAVFQKTTKGLLVPTFLGKRGHPVLIDAKYRKEIAALQQESGLRGLFLNHPDDILEVEFDSDAILKDIDTPGDYQRETN